MVYYLRESGDNYSSPDLLEVADEQFVDEYDNSVPVDDDGHSRWTRICQAGAVALFVLSIVSLALKVQTQYQFSRAFSRFV